MRAALFGTYNRGHTANRIVAAAVRAAGFDLLEVHDPLWETTRDKHASYFSPWSLLQLGARWLGSAWRLARQWRQCGGAPVVVVGFNGQLDVLLLRLLTWRSRPRIVFAPLVSLTETLVEDRRVYAPGSTAAGLLAFLDRLTCRAADVVVVDTEAHRRYFVEVLGLEPSRLVCCHLGADPDAFFPPQATRPADPGRPLEVLWFGQYLPLHGLDVVVDAVGRLAMREDTRGRLRFTFLGTGEERARVEPALRATRADVSFVDWVPYEELASRIAAADVVLGIFGPSRKASMVIPNKVYEAAAVGAAIVTADTPAIREVFAAGEEMVLCAADGRSLADAVARLADPTDGAALRARLAAAARSRMEQVSSREALGRAWRAALLGAEALAPSGEAPCVGVSVLCFQDAARTVDCVRSVLADGWPALDVLVTDNGSSAAEAARLGEGLADLPGVRVTSPGCNLGFAAGHNRAMADLFARGRDFVLLLNSDAALEHGSIEALVRGAVASRGGGPFGPRVVEARDAARVQSLGERYRPAWLWAPRSLVRVRACRQRPYAVDGVVGSAMLMPRRLVEAVGGFEESLFAYYEEVDFCLRAKAAGFRPMVVPEAVVRHSGSRGFAGGMTPLAAWLKARNLMLVGQRHARGAGRVVFEAGSGALVAASAALYRLRGRADLAKALRRGARAGRELRGGPPPQDLFDASGYASAGLGERLQGASPAGEERA